VFGDGTRFTMTTRDPLATTKTREYAGFSAASDEVNDSRVYAGIHFRTAVVHGQALGRAVGGEIVKKSMRRA
jgi:hypothetical protein